ncbi:MAG: DHH family phosphoesterase, partial [Sarcina sp.]
ITPREGAISKKDNAKIIVELLTTDDEDRAEQIAKYLHNEKFRLY